MTRRLGPGLLGLAVLAGCGGGGGGAATGGGTGGGGGEATLFAQRSESLDSREGRLVTAGATAADDLPVSGSATYTGDVAISAESTGDLRGVATLEADFGAGSVSGELGGFLAEDDAAWTGTLALAPGAIDAAQSGGQPSDFSNAVSGALTSPGGQAHVVSGDFDGDFWGDGGAYVSGTLIGGLVCVEGVCVPVTAHYNAE